MNMYNQELYHHGIINMHWGQRNGPPYPLSNSQKSNAEKNAERSNKKTDPSESKNGKDSKKNVSSLSDEELRAKIARLELEKRYNELMKEPTSQISEKESIGKKFVKKILTPSAESVGKQLTTYMLGQAVNKITGEEIFKRANKIEKKANNRGSPSTAQNDRTQSSTDNHTQGTRVEVLTPDREETANNRQRSRASFVDVDYYEPASSTALTVHRRRR